MTNTIGAEKLLSSKNWRRRIRSRSCVLLTWSLKRGLKRDSVLRSRALTKIRTSECQEYEFWHECLSYWSFVFTSVSSLLNEILIIACITLWSYVPCHYDSVKVYSLGLTVRHSDRIEIVFSVLVNVLSRRWLLADRIQWLSDESDVTFNRIVSDSFRSPFLAIARYCTSHNHQLISTGEE